MRRVFPTMGTVVSLDVVDASSDLVARVEEVFARADARFSLYRDDSELSRINAGEVSLLESGPELRDAYANSMEWRARTGGAFTPTAPNGRLDLNGVVKAIAMRNAGAMLAAAGCADWTLVVGGDLLASGVGPGGAPWITGVIDPSDRTSLLCSVGLHEPRCAIATSGSAERGDHIWSATGPSDFLQATVIADDILTADVLATAIIAGGERTLQQACDGWSIDVLTVDRAGELRATPGFRAALAVPIGSFGPP